MMVLFIIIAADVVIAPFCTYAASSYGDAQPQHVVVAMK
jgi:hypothetical protein